jgi:HK97 family phage prohead protease
VTVIASEQRALVVDLVLRDAQAVGAGRTYHYLEGRAVPYDVFADVGFFLEQHAAGSFERSTKAGSGRALPLLLFHENRTFPIGTATGWEHANGGLDGVWKLADSAEAQRAAKAADDGELRGLSIGFTPIVSDWEYVEDWNPDLGPAHIDRVTRLESRLVEVSLTPTPAFDAAEVAAVRTAFTVEQRHAAARAAGRGPRPREVDAWRDVVERLRSVEH